MKTAVLATIGLVAIFSCAERSSPVSAQTVSTETSSVTLYSPLKYRHDQSRAVFDFQGESRPARRGRWDVGYGFMYVEEEFDWLQSSSAQGHRSVIKDLGSHDWTDNLTVPEVEPLAKLKPGEKRQITVDSSGADGADGAPGTRGADGADADGIMRSRPASDPGVFAPSPRPSRPKRDGKPKIDPLFVKAIVGHMYILHVVDDVNDFYVLFRVEALERGDNCTISWRRITAPGTSAKAQ